MKVRREPAGGFSFELCEDIFAIVANWYKVDFSLLKLKKKICHSVLLGLSPFQFIGNILFSPEIVIVDIKKLGLSCAKLRLKLDCLLRLS
jgi:hypothetical protein